jgi:hypothetical protein
MRLRSVRRDAASSLRRVSCDACTEDHSYRPESLWRLKVFVNQVPDEIEHDTGYYKARGSLSASNDVEKDARIGRWSRLRPCEGSHAVVRYVEERVYYCIG